MKASPFTALLSPHGQRRRPFYKPGASEPTADSRRPAKHFPRGQSRIPEPRGAHAAPRRTRPRPAAPPDAWVGLAAEPAEAGGRPPTDEPLLQGPVGGLDGRVAARAALAGEGPPDIERLRQAVDAGVREPAAAESESAPIPSTALAPPSGGRFPRANRPLRTRRGRGGQAPNASPPCRGSPRCARADPARPPRARRGRAPRPRDARGRRGRAFRPGAQMGRRVRANEKGAPARADAPERDALSALWAYLSHRPGNKKEGPAVSGGPLGNPWWSLGGSNP